VATDLTLTNPPLTTRKPEAGDVTNGRALGDWDDVLALTVRSESDPFTAYDGNVLVRSNLAEVIWFAGENTPGIDEGEPGMRRIYRNVLVIAPERGPWMAGPNNRPELAISMHYDGTKWVANTLSDLTKREYRAARDYEPMDEDSFFPHLLEENRLDRDEDYLVLDSALAFDVRIYDPGAPLRRIPPPPASGPDVPYTALQPGDPGWPAAIPANVVGYGAYCDLGWNWNPETNAIYSALPAGSPTTYFALPRRAGWHPAFLPMSLPQPMMGFPAVYDTWSTHYENDGIDQEQVLINVAEELEWTPPPTFAAWQTGTLDQGTNGLDDEIIPGTPPVNGINGVDDPGERETAPPYDFPLRGVKVSLRIYEGDARQIRETSVTHSFAK
jgi:hypothetical protein